jgi:hypothetical protein
MLTARPAKRVKGTSLFTHEMRFEIMADEQPIGLMVFNTKRIHGDLTLREKPYVIERLREEKDETVGGALIRMVRGAEKPAPNPYLLRGAAGEILASADKSKKGAFTVVRDGRNFDFRKPSLLSRLHHLYDEGGDQSLGSVGQEKLLTMTLRMDLPESYAEAFQVYLLILVLIITLENAEQSTTYSN